MRVPVRLILGLIVLVGVGFVVLYISGPDGTPTPAGGGDTPAPAVHGTAPPATGPPPTTPGVEPPPSTPKGDGPAIHFEETEYRFGNVREGEVVKHTFAVENRGKALSYHHPVRELSPIGMWHGEPITLRLPRKDLKAMGGDCLFALLQVEDFGPILGAAEFEL